jgi:hypothetical protein
MAKMRRKKLRGKSGADMLGEPARPEVAMEKRAWRRGDFDDPDSKMGHMQGPRLEAALARAVRSLPTLFKRTTPEGAALMEVCGSRGEFERAAFRLGKSQAWADREWDNSAAAGGPAWASMDREGLRSYFHGASIVGWTRLEKTLLVEFEGPFDERHSGLEGGDRLLLAFDEPSARFFDGTVCRDLGARRAWTKGSGVDFIQKGPRQGALGRIDSHEYSGLGEPVALRLVFSRVRTLEIEIRALGVRARWGRSEIDAELLALELGAGIRAAGAGGAKAL